MNTAIQNDGALQTPKMQLVYLDFDGADTGYYGELLTKPQVTVEAAQLSAEEIALTVDRLNRDFAGKNVLFVTQRPDEGEYSTVFVGATDSFEAYGRLMGISETVDIGNQNSSDNAFVILEGGEELAVVVDTISHEVGHLVGTLDHGGEGLERYAKKGRIKSGNVLTVTDRNSADKVANYSFLNIDRGGELWVNFPEGGQGGTIFEDGDNRGTMTFYSGVLLGDFKMWYGTVISQTESMQISRLRNCYLETSALAYTGGRLLIGNTGFYNTTMACNNQTTMIDTNFTNSYAVFNAKNSFYHNAAGKNYYVSPRTVIENVTLSDSGLVIYTPLDLEKIRLLDSSVVTLEGTGSIRDSVLDGGSTLRIGAPTQATNITGSGTVVVSGWANNIQLTSGRLVVSGGTLRDSYVSSNGRLEIYNGGYAVNCKTDYGQIRSYGYIESSTLESFAAIAESAVVKNCNFEKTNLMDWISNIPSSFVYRENTKITISNSYLGNLRYAASNIYFEGTITVRTIRHSPFHAVTPDYAIFYAEKAQIRFDATWVKTTDGQLVFDYYRYGQKNITLLLSAQAELGTYNLIGGVDLALQGTPISVIMNDQTIEMAYGNITQLANGHKMIFEYVPAGERSDLYMVVFAEQYTAELDLKEGNYQLGYGQTVGTFLIRSGGMVQIVGNAKVETCSVLNDNAQLIIKERATVTNLNLYGSGNVTVAGTVDTLKGYGRANLTLSAGANVKELANGDYDAFWAHVTVHSGAVISSGKTLTNGMVVSGGQVNSVSFGNTAIQTVLDGEVRNNTFDGGGQLVSGGTVYDTGLNYASQIITSGGKAYDTQVENLSSQTISSGGVAYNTILRSKGKQIVDNGGIASGTVLEENNTTLTVCSNGKAYDTTVNSGGLTVSGGGCASNITLVGGSLINKQDANLSGNILLAGGNITNNGTVHATDVHITYDFTRGASSINGVQHLAGVNFTINVAGTQKQGLFTLNDGGATAKLLSYNFTIDGVSIGNLKLGESITFGKTTYELVSQGTQFSISTRNDYRYENYTVAENENFVLFDDDRIANATVADNGLLTLTAQAQVGNVLIQDGGQTVVSSGGQLGGGNIAAGGTLTLQAGAVITGNYQLDGTLNTTGKIDAANAKFTLNMVNRAATDVFIDNLAHVSNAQFNILAGDGLEFGEYALFGNASSNNISVNLSCQNQNFSISLTNSVLLDRKFYSLRYSGEKLTLKVEYQVEYLNEYTQINNGAVLQVYGGLKVRDVQVAKYGVINLDSGGYIKYVDVRSNGVLNANGYVDVLHQAFGVTNLKKGGYVRNTDLIGGVLNVEKGACIGLVEWQDRCQMNYEVAVGDGTTLYGFNLDRSIFWMEDGVVTNANVIGTQTVTAGASAVDCLVLTDGIQDIASGGIATQTVLAEWNGRQNILDGGKAYDTVINAGTMTVLTGGSASNITISGGALVNQLDANLSGNIQLAGGSITNAGAVNATGVHVTYDLSRGSGKINAVGNLVGADFTINIAGTQKQGLFTLNDGGEAAKLLSYNFTIDGVSIGNLKFGESITINFTVYELVNNGTQFSIFTRENWHYENFTIAANENFRMIDGDQITNATVAGNGILTLTLQAQVDNVLIQDGGQTVVSSGGRLGGGDVAAGGTLTLQAGAVIKGDYRLDGTLNAAGLVNAANAKFIVNLVNRTSTEVFIDNLANVSDAQFDIQIGDGLALGEYVLFNNGYGLSLSMTLVSSLQSNAISVADTVNLAGKSYSLTTHSSGKVSLKVQTHVQTLEDLVVDANGTPTLQLYEGTTALRTTVNSGGILLIDSGADAKHSTITNGTVTVNGAIADTTMTGGVLKLESGGRLSAINLENGILYVAKGATATDIKLKNGGKLSYEVAVDGAVLHGFNRDNSVFQVQNGVAVNVEVAGEQTVTAGASAVDNRVLTGTQIIASGGVASRTVLTGGNAYQSIRDGGKAYDTTMSSGTMAVSGGGSASNITISGGKQINQQGANLSGNILLTGGSITNAGTVNATGAHVTYDLRGGSGGMINGVANLVGADFTICIAGTQQQGLFTLNDGGEAAKLLSYNFTIDGLTIGSLKFGENITIGRTTYGVVENGTQFSIVTRDGYRHETYIVLANEHFVLFDDDQISNALVKENGTLTLTNLAQAGTVRILNGGQTVVCSGGQLGGGNIAAGGTLTLQAGATIAGNYQLDGMLNAAGLVNAANAKFTLNLVNRTATEVFIDNLANVSGAQFDIQVGDGLAFGEYVLFGNGYGVDLSVSISKSQNQSVAISFAESAGMDGKNYSLAYSDGNVVLNVTRHLQNLTDLVIGEGGTAALRLYDGTTTQRATVNAGGELLIDNGAYAENSTLTGGTVTVNGVMDSIVMTGGVINAAKGAVVTGIDFNGGQLNYEVAADGAILSGFNRDGSTFQVKRGVATHVDVVGTQTIAAGASAVDNRVLDGGIQKVTSGGVAKNSQITSGGVLSIADGGKADSFTLGSSAVVEAAGGSILTGDIGFDGGTLKVSGAIDCSGATFTLDIGDCRSEYVFIENIDRITGGNFQVSVHASPLGVYQLATTAGASFAGTLHVSGANVDFALSLTDNSVKLNRIRYTLSESAGKLALTIENSFEHYVDQKLWTALTLLNGDTALRTAVNHGGCLNVGNGTSADQTTLNIQAEMYVSSGGSATNTTLNYASLHVLNGGSISGASIYIGAKVIVSSGGRATGLAILEKDGNTVTEVHHGDQDTLVEGVNYDGSKFQLSGGVASGFVLGFSSVQTVFSGGVVKNVKLEEGGQLVVNSGGSASGVILTEGGVLTTEVRGGDSQTRVEGTNHDMSTFLLANGSASGFVVGSYASQTIFSGGKAYDTRLSGFGASQSILAGGEASNVVMDTATEMSIASGGVVKDVTLAEEATLNIANGASVTGLVVQSGGVMNFSVEKDNYGTIIQGRYWDDTIFSLKDGIASGFQVFVNADQEVGFGGIIYDTIVRGGTQITSSGGIAIGTALYGATYYSSEKTGTQHIFTGGIGVNTQVHSGGVLDVRGTGINAEIHSGGLGRTASGGKLSNLQLDKGGELQLEEGTILSNTITLGGTVTLYKNNFENPEAIFDAEEATIVFDLSERTLTDAAIISSVSGFTGAAFAVSVSGAQENGRYALAASGAGFDKTITLHVGNQDPLYSLTVNGPAVAFNDKYYTLVVDNDGMFLNIASNSSARHYSDIDVGSAHELQDIVLNAGDTAQFVRVKADGMQTIAAGGAAANIAVETDGQLTVERGGMLNTVVVLNGGVLTLNDGAWLRGTTSISGQMITANNLNTADAQLQLVVGERDAADTRLMVDNLANANFKGYMLNIAGNQKQGVYVLAGNAANFAGEFVVVDEEMTLFGTMGINQTLQNNFYTYALSVDASNRLVLTVTEEIANPWQDVPDAPAQLTVVNSGEGTFFGNGASSLDNGKSYSGSFFGGSAVGGDGNLFAVVQSVDNAALNVYGGNQNADQNGNCYLKVAASNLNQIYGGSSNGNISGAITLDIASSAVNFVYASAIGKANGTTIHVSGLAQMKNEIQGSTLNADNTGASTVKLSGGTYGTGTADFLLFAGLKSATTGAQTLNITQSGASTLTLISTADSVVTLKDRTYLFGGGYAMGMGSGLTTTTVQGGSVLSVAANVEGRSVIYGGGRAYGNGHSVLTGGTRIHITTTTVLAGAQLDVYGGSLNNGLTTTVSGGSRIAVDGINTFTGKVNLYGGGNLKGSTVDTSGICIGTAGNFNDIVLNNIYGGGAGGAKVLGNSHIIFSGNNNRKINVTGILSGDGTLAGTVLGSKILEFDRFDNQELAAMAVRNFDKVVIDSQSSVSFSNKLNLNSVDSFSWNVDVNNLAILDKPVLTFAEVSEWSGKLSFQVTIDSILEAGNFRMISVLNGSLDALAGKKVSFELGGLGGSVLEGAIGDYVQWKGFEVGLELADLDANGTQETLLLAFRNASGASDPVATALELCKNDPFAVGVEDGFGDVANWDKKNNGMLAC